VELRANIELPSEAEVALEQGARGIGLYRTEFLYLDRTEPPSEDEQYETYRRVVETLAPLPVTLRTFDIGGDKFASVFQVPAEMNPALGLRAVRLGLARQDIFLTQLRAMIRSSVHGKMRIMVPMIASLGELREVRRLFDRAVSDVDAAGQPRSPEIPLGMMVEVPSAAIMADEFAIETEFMSIGTNDLVQYTLAVDRSSPELAYLASFFDPAILRLVRMVITAGVHRNRPVFVCGAMASDPLAAILLVGMGLRELSMESAAIPEIREAIGSVTVAEAEQAAEAALTGETARDIERVLLERFGARLDVGE
jgi:phosphotransferase system enzyme I (PtsI)